MSKGSNSPQVIVHYLKVAGCTIKFNFVIEKEQISAQNHFIERFKNNYQGFLLIYPQKPDCEIFVRHTVTHEYLLKKDSSLFLMSISKKIKDNLITTNYYISDTQLQLIIRDICQNFLLKYNGFIMHGSSVEINGKANIFLGDSGAGKSTIMSILSNKFAPLGDDSFIIKRRGNNFEFYSTITKEKNTWFVKNHYARKPGNVFFLKKAKTNLLKKISDKKIIFNLLIKQLYTERKTMDEQVKFVLDFVSRKDNFFILSFGLDNNSELIDLIKNSNEEA